MSLREDYEIVKQEEAEPGIKAIVWNSLDDCAMRVFEAILDGDDAEAGRIIRLNLEEDFRDLANAIQDSDPNWRVEARQIDNRDRARDMK